MHSTPHPLAGRTVTVTPAAPLSSHPGTDPLDLWIEDWADRVFGRSWLAMDGNMCALAYADRSAAGHLPTDDEVIYGKAPTGLAHLVHVSELPAGGDHA